MINKTLIKILLISAAVLPVAGGRVSQAAEQLKLPTYHTAPFGSYDRLRLVPRDGVAPLTSPCQVGTLYVGQESVSVPQTRLYFCKDVGAGLDNGEWGTVSGDSYWTEETVGPSNVNLYPKDTLSNPNLNVGIGTDSPESRLHIKNGDLLIEDPSAELMIEDSDANEVWNIGTGSANQLEFISCSDCDNSSISRPLLFRNYGGDVRVGIETKDPDHKLDITGSTVNLEHIDPQVRLNAGAAGKIWTLVTEDDYFKIRLPSTEPQEKLQIRNDGEMRIRNIHPSLTLDDTDGNDWRISSEGTHGTYMRFEYREDTVNPAATFVPAVEFGGTGRLALWGLDRGIRLKDTNSYGTYWWIGSHDSDPRPEVLKFFNAGVTLSNGERFVPCEIGPHGNLTLRPNAEAPEDVQLLLDPNPWGDGDPSSTEWKFSVHAGCYAFRIENLASSMEYYFAGTIGGLGIGTEPEPETSLTIPNLTVGGTHSLYVKNSTGGVYESDPWTSSRTKKKDIVPLRDDFYKILDIQPVTFLDKTTSNPGFGVIAEEVDKLGLKNLVIYDQDGAVQSFRYEMVGVYSLPIVKDQQYALEAAGRQSAEMDQKLTDLESRLEKLEKKKQGL